MADINKYSFKINERCTISFHVNDDGVITNNSGIITINEMGIANKKIEELIYNVACELKFKLEGDDVKGSIYQMFSVGCRNILPIIALKFLINGMKDEVRLFDKMPSKKQLNNLVEECKTDQKCVIFPIPFENHFATGICDKGVFYIFDSTRQEAKGKTTTINGATFYTLYNNKKFQSELTGTCGFWTLYFCLEFADLMERYKSSDGIIFGDEINPELDKRFLDKVDNKVYNITKIILENNKKNVCDILNGTDITFGYFFKEILKDVQKSGEGVSPSYDGSKKLEQILEDISDKVYDGSKKKKRIKPWYKVGRVAVNTTKDATRQPEDEQQLLNQLIGANDNFDDNLALDDCYNRTL